VRVEKECFFDYLHENGDQVGKDGFIMMFGFKVMVKVVFAALLDFISETFISSQSRVLHFVRCMLA